MQLFVARRSRASYLNIPPTPSGAPPSPNTSLFACISILTFPSLHLPFLLGQRSGVADAEGYFICSLRFLVF